MRNRLTEGAALMVMALGVWFVGAEAFDTGDANAATRVTEGSLRLFALLLALVAVLHGVVLPAAGWLGGMALRAVGRIRRTTR